jgi:hypothetical protein
VLSYPPEKGGLQPELVFDEINPKTSAAKPRKPDGLCLPRFSPCRQTNRTINSSPERKIQPPRPPSAATPPREENCELAEGGTPSLRRRPPLHGRNSTISPLPIAGVGPGERVFKIPLQRRNCELAEGGTPSLRRRPPLQGRNSTISPLPLAGEGPGERVFKIPLQRRNCELAEGGTPSLRSVKIVQSLLRVRRFGVVNREIQDKMRLPP